MKAKLFLLFFTLFCFAFNLLGKNDSAEPATIYELIKEQNLKSFPPRKPDWWRPDGFRDRLKHRLKKQLKPQPRDIRDLTFDILDSIEKKHKSTPFNKVIDPTTWNDLNFFCGQSIPSFYLGSIIDRTLTEVGKVSLFKMLSLPIININQLIVRQSLIKKLVINHELFTRLHKQLKVIKKSENLILPLWDGEPFEDFAEQLYFKAPIIKKLNTSPLALDIANRISHLRRILGLKSHILATVLLPLEALANVTCFTLPKSLENLAEKDQELKFLLFFLFLSGNKWAHSFTCLVSAFFSGCTIPEAYDWQAGKFLLENLLHFKLRKIEKYIHAMKSIEKLAQANPTLKSSFPSLDSLTQLFYARTKTTPELNELFALLKTDTFKNKHSVLSYSGRIIRAYQLIHKHKESLEDALMAIGEIDAYLSIAKLFKEFQGKTATFSFAKFSNADRPTIELVDFWNPFIDSKKVVVNSLTLGTSGHRPNAIVTGPNAGGKSTNLKAVAICLVLAQTFGIAPAKTVVITPFSYITTHLNIADDIGAGNSLFKTEVIRAQTLVNTIENLKAGEFSFSAMDEVFNGTTPAEGQAAAYSIANHVGNFPNSICIIATHFVRLAELEQATETFSNYRVAVTREDDNTLSYPFKLEKGISQQHVALDMLRLEGIDNSIVAQAQAFLDNEQFAKS